MWIADARSEGPEAFVGRGRRHAAVLAAAVLVFTGVPQLVATGPGGTASAQSLLDQLDDAEERVEGLSSDLDRATARYEEAWARIEALQVEQDELRRRAGELETELAQASDALTDRAVQMFKRGQPAGSSFLLLGASGPSEAADRASLLAAVQRRDLGRAEEAGALRTALDQTQALLDDQQRQLDELQAQLEADRDAVADQLDQARSVASDLADRSARQRRIERGAQQGVYACIFDQGSFSFRDTWGAPRSGGRSHRGTDVFAPMGQPVYAITSGTIQRHSSSGLGGIGLYLRGDDGNVFYYAHLQSIDGNGAVGNRVEAGELIAYNGSTGNASPSAPHVHFELAPGGGAQVNPFPWLAAACF